MRQWRRRLGPRQVMEAQALVTALATACPPRTAAEALVLVVHASCLLRSDLTPDDEEVDTEDEGIGPVLLRQFHTLSPLSPSCPTSAFPMLRYRAQGGKWRVSLKPVVSCSEAKGPSTQALGQQGWVLKLYGRCLGEGVAVHRLELLVTDHIHTHHTQASIPDTHVQVPGSGQGLYSVDMGALGHRLQVLLLSKLLGGAVRVGALWCLEVGLLQAIMLALPTPSIAALAHTCKACGLAWEGEGVWAQLLHRDFPTAPPRESSTPARAAYRTLYEAQQRTRRRHVGSGGVLVFPPYGLPPPGFAPPVPLPPFAPPLSLPPGLRDPSRGGGWFGDTGLGGGGGWGGFG